MRSQKNTIINAIIDREGGYVNDPNDSGGATNYGITEYVARASGYTGAIKHMPRGFAYRVYEQKYWQALSLSTVEPIATSIAAELADTAVNMGPSRAAEFLQRCLNVMNQRGRLYPDLNVDGSIGPATCAALTSFITRRGSEGEAVLLKGLNSLQGAFYINLAERRQKDEAFIYGWLKERV